MKCFWSLKWTNGKSKMFCFNCNFHNINFFSKFQNGNVEVFFEEIMQIERTTMTLSIDSKGKLGPHGGDNKSSKLVMSREMGPPLREDLNFQVNWCDNLKNKWFASIPYTIMITTRFIDYKFPQLVSFLSLSTICLQYILS